MGEVEFKPRDLGSDRGYRVALIDHDRGGDMGEVRSKPAPFADGAKGAAPKSYGIVRAKKGTAVPCPYECLVMRD